MPPAAREREEREKERERERETRIGNQYTKTFL
jgi:hypothetical protein